MICSSPFFASKGNYSVFILEIIAILRVLGIAKPGAVAQCMPIRRDQGCVAKSYILQRTLPVENFSVFNRYAVFSSGYILAVYR